MQNKRYFITYGDEGFESAKKRICTQAVMCGEFDEIIAYGRDHLSSEVKFSQLLQITRGGGLWCWKPDVILTTLEQMRDGDCLVYCDAGCTLQRAKEWNFFWRILQQYDMIASRIFQQTIQWTRKELLDSMHTTNLPGWGKCYQYMATTIILKKSPFTMRFVREWRSFMLENPHMVMDVTEKEKPLQHQSFVENRHDQSVYSALVYKYQHQMVERARIYAQWEHVEDYDIFDRQAIRATRLRNESGQLTKQQEIKSICKRIIKDFIYKPFWAIPRQWYYERVQKK